MNNERIYTPYVHIKNGWPVVIAGGIGGANWSVYLVKPTGSLQRCKNFPVHQGEKKAESKRDLTVYMTQPGKKIFREATGADSRL